MCTYIRILQVNTFIIHEDYDDDDDEEEVEELDRRILYLSPTYNVYILIHLYIWFIYIHIISVCINPYTSFINTSNPETDYYLYFE